MGGARGGLALPGHAVATQGPGAEAAGLRAGSAPRGACGRRPAAVVFEP